MLPFSTPREIQYVPFILDNTKAFERAACLGYTILRGFTEH